MKTNEWFRKQLLSDRLILLRQVARAEDDLRWLDSNVEAEPVDEGQESALALVLARLDDRGTAEIQAIDRALARIAENAYGKCLGCGRQIPAARLKAMPTAEHCVRCAQD